MGSAHQKSVQKRKGFSKVWPLLVLPGLLTLFAIFPTQIANGISFLCKCTPPTYPNPEGAEPVTSITFTLPSDVGNAIVWDGVSAGFTSLPSGNTLTVSGGTLPPGQTLTVMYHFTRYVSPGVRTFPVVATTAGGQTSNWTGTLSITESLLLRGLTFFEDYGTPLTLLGGLGLLAGIGGWLWGRRKESQFPKRESQSQISVETRGGIQNTGSYESQVYDVQVEVTGRIEELKE